MVYWDNMSVTMQGHVWKQIQTCILSSYQLCEHIQSNDLVLGSHDNENKSSDFTLSDAVTDITNMVKSEITSSCSLRH